MSPSNSSSLLLSDFQALQFSFLHAEVDFSYTFFIRIIVHFSFDYSKISYINNDLKHTYGSTSVARSNKRLQRWKISREPPKVGAGKSMNANRFESLSARDARLTIPMLANLSSDSSKPKNRRLQTMFVQQFESNNVNIAWFYGKYFLCCGPARIWPFRS